MSNDELEYWKKSDKQNGALCTENVVENPAMAFQTNFEKGFVLTFW